MDSLLQLHGHGAAPEVTPHVLVCLVALGMALAFIVADRQSPTSRMLALSFAFIGIAIDLNVAVTLQWAIPLWVTGWFAVPETLATVALLEWILRVRRTVPPGDLNTRGGDRLLRLGQASALAYSLLAIAYPEARHREFVGGLDHPDALARPAFWLFATPILISAACGILSMLLLLNRKPDQPERIRLLAMIGAIPFFAASFVLPLTLSAVAMIVGEMIFLIGAVEYHVLQGQRGQFMSRFLSSQVADLVRKRGLEHAMQQNFLELTVVCCDLRGFTPYAQAHPSSQVIQVLKDYYDAVGVVVSEFDATIKDFAGDGILMLVGAPLPMADHAARALEMSRRVRSAAREVTERWSVPGHRLGIGVGVASGKVTVGIIGSASRLEYTAVGPAVNLASRLCEQARDGEILVNHRTAELAQGPALELRQALPIKGFAEPVPYYAVPA